MTGVEERVAFMDAFGVASDDPYFLIHNMVDFYRCPTTGDWVYKWADVRLVLRTPEAPV